MPTWLTGWLGDASLPALFVYSFLSSTLLPGGSELALAAVVAAQPGEAGAALALATLGNTLGGLTSYACGRFLPQQDTLSATRGGRAVQRYGAPALLLSWLPLIGDLLCVAAGWLRIAWGRAALAIALGKFARYWLVVETVHATLP